MFLNSSPSRFPGPQVTDLSLIDYIAVKAKHDRYTPHSAGRFQKRRFRKAQCPVVERWVMGMIESSELLPRVAPLCKPAGWDFDNLLSADVRH